MNAKELVWCIDPCLSEWSRLMYHCIYKHDLLVLILVILRNVICIHHTYMRLKPDLSPFNLQ